MDQPNDPPNQRIVQRLMRMAGCVNWLTGPLEEIVRVVRWFTEPGPAEDIDPAAPDIIVRCQ